MSPEQNFWRLLGDYERLTRDEAAAIWEWQFAALTEIHETKMLILGELVKISRMIGLTRANPAFQNRLRLLGEAQQRNASLVDDGIAKARREYKMLNATSLRLRSIDHVYAADSRGGHLKGTFCAQV